MTESLGGHRYQDVDVVVSELRRQLLRYRADRHPIQHATAQFHLGAALLHAERTAQATLALTTAAELFAAADRPVDVAKARNLLGAAHRAEGDRTAAARAFRDAGRVFAEHGHGIEEAATRFNLGLVLREEGDEAGAEECFERALGRFDEVGAVAQAAAAARELGTSRLNLGEVDDAIAALTRAEELADRAADQAAIGAAANILGLALLAAQRTADAVEAFERAAGTNPRRLRPDAYAMAKANLALALERDDRPSAARLAARQAVGTPGAPPAVVEQATDVLSRLGPDPDALHLVLDETGVDAWTDVLRDELVRWGDEPPPERRTDAAAWIAGQLRRSDTAERRAAAWLEVLLEQPPALLDRVARSTAEALAELGPEDRETFRAPVRRAMARFGVPQLVRLERVFARVAGEVGTEWS